MGKPVFPALVHGYSFETYTKIRGEHFSGLKALEVSPRHYLAKATTEVTQSLRVGRATHELICDPRANGVVVYDGHRAGNEWKAFAADHADKTILNAKEHATVLAMRNAIEDNPTARDLFAHGRGEATAIWDDGDIRCKARIDWILPDGGMVELKTAKSALPRSFGNACASRMYHAQIAFYSYGLTLAQGFTPPSHTIVVIEKSPPYDVAVFRVGQEVLEAGARKVMTWLERLRECRKSGSWPGISGEGMIDLVLPSYALTDDLSDIEMEEEHG